MADYLSIIPVDIRVVVIEKDIFRKAIGIRDKSDFKGTKERKKIKDLPYRIMSTCLFSWFADYLDKNNSTGQIIADSRRGSDHQLIETLNLCKEGAVPIREKNKTLINEKIKALTFAEKDYLSGGLEITDLVSYISFFRVKREISSNANLGFDKIWKELKEIAQLMYLSEEDVKRFFQIKKDEVYKHLK